MSRYLVIGLMSGTSLDGLDMALCEFEKSGNAWHYEILDAKTLPYEKDWQDRLTFVPSLTGRGLIMEHLAYGHYLGAQVREYCQTNGLQPDFIASHGHTVFHEPHVGLTLQLGEGQSLANASGWPVVCDFRTQDVLLGGHGAPLVPMGDKLLFPQYDYCLNIGGISNISYEEQGYRKAFDICPANMVLNTYARRFNLPFDRNGDLARQGSVITELLRVLDELDYYQVKPPKSLGREWVESVFLPLVQSYDTSPGDILRTLVEHISIKISQSLDPLNDQQDSSMLITGGGARNAFLIERVRHHSGTNVIVPDDTLVDYKEALIFGLLGVLRWRSEVNCLASVTGASRDHSSGVVFFP